MTGREQIVPPAFRVTVATFNVRARRVVQSLGFRNAGSFRALAYGPSYEMLIRSEPARHDNPVE